MQMIKTVSKWIGAASLGVAAQCVLAAPLSGSILQNGGFEPFSDPSSWTATGNVASGVGNSTLIHDGSDSAVFSQVNDTQSPGALSQSGITLLDGATYILSFYLSEPAAPGVLDNQPIGDNYLAITLTGQVLGGFGISPDSSWGFYESSFTAAGETDATLSFAASSLLRYQFALDDVSLVCVENCGDTNPNPSVPEPGSLALVGVALAGLAWAGRRRKMI